MCKFKEGDRVQIVLKHIYQGWGLKKDSIGTVMEDHPRPFVLWDVPEQNTTKYGTAVLQEDLILISASHD